MINLSIYYSGFDFHINILVSNIELLHLIDTTEKLDKKSYQWFMY